MVLDHDLAIKRYYSKALLANKYKNTMTRNRDANNYRNNFIGRKLMVKRKMSWKISIKWRSYKTLKLNYWIMSRDKLYSKWSSRVNTIRSCLLVTPSKSMVMEHQFSDQLRWTSKANTILIQIVGTLEEKDFRKDQLHNHSMCDSLIARSILLAQTNGHSWNLKKIRIKLQSLGIYSNNKTISSV